MLKRYSKPILTNGSNSAYVEESFYKIIILHNEIKNGVVQIVIRFELNSKVINQLLTDDKAAVGLKVTTNYRVFYYKNIDYNSDFIIELEINDLERYDSIKITSYITAKEKIEYRWNEELKKIYTKEYSFVFNESEILAESNEEKLEYKLSGDPFIKIQRSDELSNSGIKFDVEKNLIYIKVGTEYNNAYWKLQADGAKVCCKDILNTNLAFNAILYSLLKVISDDNPSSYYENKWFKALNYSFEVDGYADLQEFIEDMHNKIDINRIYEVVQRMIGNQLEIKTIDTYRSIK